MPEWAAIDARRWLYSAINQNNKMGAITGANKGFIGASAEVALFRQGSYRQCEIECGVKFSSFEMLLYAIMPLADIFLGDNA